MVGVGGGYLEDGGLEELDRDLAHDVSNLCWEADEIEVRGGFACRSRHVRSPRDCLQASNKDVGYCSHARGIPRLSRRSADQSVNVALHP